MSYTTTTTISSATPSSEAPHITISAESTLDASYHFGTSPLSSKSRQLALKTYLLGYPISHSLSPAMQNALYASNGLPWNYSLLESPTSDVLLPKLKSPDCIGAAVTMPFKISYMSQVDDLTHEGRVIGAINTIFIRKDAHGQRRYIGTNTDCIGVRDAFVHNVPNLMERFGNRPALVIGGGGACRSAVYALHQWLGASKIYLVNRLKSEVDEVIDLFSSFPSIFAPELIHVDSVAMAQQLESPGLVVGTVPDYPPKEPCEFLLKDIVKTFMEKGDNSTPCSPKGAVLEMCYHPMRTTFFDLAENAGWKVLSGTEAIIYQGIAQQVLWTETPWEEFDAKIPREAIESRLRQH